MSITKITYTKDWNNPSDFPTVETSEAVVRSDMQELYTQIRTGVNNIVDELEGTSGATNTGINPITGVTGTTVQGALEDLKTQIDTKADDTATTAALALKESISDANNLIQSVTYTSATGTFTFTKQGGSTIVVDTTLEKVPGSMALVEDPVGSGTYYLVIYDTSTPPIELSRCPVTALFNAIDVQDTDTIDLTLATGSAGKKTLSASVKDGSITSVKLESTIMSTIQGYAQAASDSADSASASATNASNYATNASGYATTASGYADTASGYATTAGVSASFAGTKATEASRSAGAASGSAASASDYATTASGKATLAESWAVGGTGTRTGEDTNNAKYWCEQASATASADMKKSDYDPTTGGVTTPVLAAGGIPAYVEANGGKIDTIKVNGTAQTITNKTVDISVPLVDATPTSASPNAVASGGVYTALAGKSTVSVSSSGTATDTINYITVDGTEKKIGGSALASYTITIPSSATWTQDANANWYTTTISSGDATNLLSTDKPMADISLASAEDSDEVDEILEAWQQIFRIVANNGSCTFYSATALTVEMSVSLAVIR